MGILLHEIEHAVREMTTPLNKNSSAKGEHQQIQHTATPLHCCTLLTVVTWNQMGFEHCAPGYYSSSVCQGYYRCCKSWAFYGNIVQDHIPVT